MRTLGIDPGLRLTGYGCVEPTGDSRSSRAGEDAFLVEAGVLRLPARTSVANRLAELDRDLTEILERLRPTVIAVEKVFSHYRHPTTAAIMGHARGVVLLAAHRAGVEPVELSATEVKKSLTGHGHASKAQIQSAVRSQLNLSATPAPADVADAIAIALCAARRAAHPAAP